MAKLSKHHSNLNVLTRWGLRNLLTLLWHWWQRRCATTKRVQKSLEFTGTCGFGLLWMSSSNHYNCEWHTRYSQYRSHRNDGNTQDQSQILHVFIGNYQLITTFCHHQLFFPFSCWLIHWFVTRNSIKLKVSVINYWSIFLWTTLRSNLTKLPASIERMVNSFVLCPIQRLGVYSYGIPEQTLCLFYWFWITKTETDDIHTHIGLLMAILL